MKRKLYGSNKDIRLNISSLETNRSNLSEQEILDKLNSEVTSISDLKPSKPNVITEVQIALYLYHTVFSMVDHYHVVDCNYMYHL